MSLWCFEEFPGFSRRLFYEDRSFLAMWSRLSLPPLCPRRNTRSLRLPPPPPPSRRLLVVTDPSLDQ